MRDGLAGAVFLRGIARRGEGEEAIRGARALLRTYSPTESDADCAASLQLDKLPKGGQKWAGDTGRYVSPARKEVLRWGRGNIGISATAAAGPIAEILAGSCGIRPRGAATGKAGGLLRQTYLCDRARRIVTTAVLQGGASTAAP